MPTPVPATCSTACRRGRRAWTPRASAVAACPALCRVPCAALQVVELQEDSPPHSQLFSSPLSACPLAATMAELQSSRPRCRSCCCIRSQAKLSTPPRPPHLVPPPVRTLRAHGGRSHTRVGPQPPSPCVHVGEPLGAASGGAVPSLECSQRWGCFNATPRPPAWPPLAVSAVPDGLPAPNSRQGLRTQI